MNTRVEIDGNLIVFHERACTLTDPRGTWRRPISTMLNARPEAQLNERYMVMRGGMADEGVGRGARGTGPTYEYATAGAP